MESPCVVWLERKPVESQTFKNWDWHMNCQDSLQPNYIQTLLVLLFLYQRTIIKAVIYLFTCVCACVFHTGCPKGIVISCLFSWRIVLAQSCGNIRMWYYPTARLLLIDGLHPVNHVFSPQVIFQHAFWLMRAEIPIQRQETCF